MYDCEDVGIIFPAENKNDEFGMIDANSYYYDKHRIETIGDKSRYYHQLELFIGSKSEIILSSKNKPEDESRNRGLAEYLRECF